MRKTSGAAIVDSALRVKGACGASACRMLNDKDAIECQRCSMLRYDNDDEKDTP
jgi:hypothetical protein